MRYSKSSIALLMGLLVFGAALAGDWLVRLIGFRPELIWGIDDLFSAVLAGLLVFHLLRSEERRRRVVADMNHHVRNALTVIKGANYLSGEHTAMVEESIARIEWALREVLQGGAPAAKEGAPLASQRTAG